MHGSQGEAEVGAWVVGLGDPASREAIGGKAARLGELLRAGYPVPAGFVVTTAAWDLFRRSSLAGLIGLSAGMRSGLELHLLGQSFGIDFLRPAIKIPAVGRIGV